MIPTLFGITVLTFAIMHLAPGDPAELRYSGAPGAAEAAEAGRIEQAIERFRREHLLDQPVWRQYLHYVGPFDLSEEGHPWFGGTGLNSWGGLVLGDMGRELFRPNVGVGGEILRRLRVTAPLALAALLLSYLLALPLGIYSCMRQGSVLDVTAAALVFLLYSVPAFWAALLLQLAFGANGLGWLPIIGLADQNAETFSFFGRLWDYLRHALLPVAVLTMGGFAYLSRQMRAGLLETIRQDYVRTARAKGLSERTVILKHALRNSLGPVVMLFATILPALIGGSVIVESIFDLDGLGNYAYGGLLQRDYFVVMGTTTFSALVTLVCILLADLAYAWLDPRVRYD